MIDEILKERKIEIGLTDGLLLVQVDSEGYIHPHVLRLGLLTEGRLEMGMMPIFNEIVKTRTRLAQQVIANAKLSASAEEEH